MAKSIRDAMTSNPCAIDSDKSVAYAAKMMRDEDVGFAPIVKGDRLVGTVTDRDIAVKVVSEGKDPETTTVLEVASNELVTVHPDQDLEEALTLMAHNQVRRLPVVEQDGQLVGVLAQADEREGALVARRRSLECLCVELGCQLALVEPEADLGLEEKGPLVVPLGAGGEIVLAHAQPPAHLAQ